MFAGKILLKLFPIRFYYKSRSLYRNFKKKLFKPLDEEEFRKLLTEKMGVQKGDALFVHSSIDKLNITFSPFRLFSLLQDSVGQEGTLIFPAWHFTERAELYLGKGKIFDVRKSPAALGLIPELARRNPHSQRSLHPTTSIVAIGKHATDLVSEHGNSIYPCDEKSPFYKMMELNAKIIGLGVSTEFLSFVHCPEDVMKQNFPVKTRTSKIFEAKVIDLYGNTKTIPTLVADVSIKNRDIPGFIKKHITPEIALDFSYRGNQFFIAHSSQLYSCIVKLALQGNTIYGNEKSVQPLLL